MSPFAVFFRTLSRSSAICLGVALVIVNPSFEWSSSRSARAQKSPKEAAVDGLIAALKDTDAGVRRQAAGALGEVGNARAVPALIGAINDEQVEVRLRVISALAEFSDAQAAPALRQALKDSEPRVRARAAAALGELGDRSSVGALAALVRDANVEVRRRAILALAEIGDDSAIAALTAALKDDDAGVRRAAVGALAALGGGGTHRERFDDLDVDVRLELNAHPHPNPRPHPNPHPESKPAPESAEPAAAGRRTVAWSGVRSREPSPHWCCFTPQPGLPCPRFRCSPNGACASSRRTWMLSTPPSERARRAPSASSAIAPPMRSRRS